jgi:hypothetical protein
MMLSRGGVRTLGRPRSWSNQVLEIYERVTGQPRPEMFATPAEQRTVPRNEEPPM